MKWALGGCLLLAVGGPVSMLVYVGWIRPTVAPVVIAIEADTVQGDNSFPRVYGPAVGVPDDNGHSLTWSTARRFLPTSDWPPLTNTREGDVRARRGTLPPAWCLQSVVFLIIIKRLARSVAASRLSQGTLACAFSLGRP